MVARMRRSVSDLPSASARPESRDTERPPARLDKGHVEIHFIERIAVISFGSEGDFSHYVGFDPNSLRTTEVS